MIILKPEDPPAETECIPPATLPAHVRAFGKLPNAEKWLPGDLILVSSMKPDFVQRAIKKVQIKGGYSEEHAQWHHAAVYLGDYGLCEASRNGVNARKIYPYIGGHLIRVRRDKNLKNNQQWKIAVQALLRQKFSYSFGSIIKILWQSRNGFWNTSFSPRNTSRRAIICSQLYAESYGHSSGKTVQPDMGIPVTPAALSCCELFQDVEIEWLKLPQYHV